MSARNKRLNSECDQNEEEFFSITTPPSANPTSQKDNVSDLESSNDLDDDFTSEDVKEIFEDDLQTNNKHECNSLSKLCISNSSIVRYFYKTRQPHIIYLDAEQTNNRNHASKVSLSEVLNALDMPGAVRDTKRFNYVCRLVQIIINEKLRSLSGNAQRTLFMIVKQMLIHVIKKQENLNVMRKLLVDFKKKIQECYYYYFYYVGSQKLCEKHLATINRWQEMLDNPVHANKGVKRLVNGTKRSSNTLASFDNIPFDCKLEIMRRLNTGLDLVNLSKCNQTLNTIISKELAIWQNLCKYHFQQTHINSLLTTKRKDSNNTNDTLNQEPSELDWKFVYFRLKRRYGHREIYADMIHKCFYCKCLFWKEIGHPCVIAASLSSNDQDALEAQTEPITPKKLIDLLIK
jgi:F-box protein 25/32